MTNPPHPHVHENVAVMEVFMDEVTNTLWVQDCFTGDESAHYDISRSGIWRSHGGSPGPKELSWLIAKSALELLKKVGT